MRAAAAKAPLHGAAPPLWRGRRADRQPLRSTTGSKTGSKTLGAPFAGGRSQTLGGIEVGHQNTGGHGWAKTEHVVVTPDELPGLLAELAEHWLTANPDAAITLTLDDDEAGDVHHALSIAVSRSARSASSPAEA